MVIRSETSDHLHTIYHKLNESHEEDPVLYASTARLKQDKLTCAVRVGMKVTVMIKMRIVMSLLLEHSLLRLPETNLFPEKENVSLVARKTRGNDS